MRQLISVIHVTAVVALFPPSLSGMQEPARPSPEALRSAIARQVAMVPGAEVGVSVRDLHSGLTLGLNETTEFHAASTMKVPVMLEVLRSVDEGRLALDQGVLLVNSFHSIVDGSPYDLSPGSDGDTTLYQRTGERVAIRDLMERMIVRSSNLATNVLVSLVGAVQTTETARRLGASRIQVRRGVEDGKAFAAGLINTTTSADLAVLLERIEAGNALSPASARLMKEILLRQEFNDEIPAGLPAGVAVAHKTGAITATLHDAAIVYPPGRRPYVLVVLTRGIRDERVAREMIVSISRLVWTALAAAGAPAAATSP